MALWRQNHFLPHPPFPTCLPDGIPLCPWHVHPVALEEGTFLRLGLGNQRLIFGGRVRDGTDHFCESGNIDGDSDSLGYLFHRPALFFPSASARFLETVPSARSRVRGKGNCLLFMRRSDVSQSHTKTQELRAKRQSQRVMNKVPVAVLRANTTFFIDLLIIMGFLLTIGVCTTLTSPSDARAEVPKKKQLHKDSPKNPASKPTSPQKTPPVKGKDKATPPGTPSPPPAPSTQHPSPRSKHRLTQRSGASPIPAVGKYHETFMVTLANAPFPLSGKDADSYFFDFVDPKTGERFHTTRTFERLSEKDHYRDGTALFYVPTRFNPNKPFLYVVFFHGNRSDVQQCLKDYRLDGQIESSGKNAILVLPQLAKNASDSSPGKFSRRNVFRSFMQEAAQALSQKVGKKHLRTLEQAPIVLAAFSGGYKPLACTLDRGGVASRIKGVLLLDALYEDLYIFGKWLLNPIGGGVFMNIFAEGSACEEKTEILANFLREHQVPFKEEWPKRGFPKKPIFLIGSSFEHMQIPCEGPPREPLAALLRSLKI